MLLPEELYVAPLKERWNNTREWLKKKDVPQGGALQEKFSDDIYAKAESEWPSFCFGAANGWLLIVGPSPGNSEPEKSKIASEYQKLDFKLWVGAPHPGFTFEDRSHYFNHVSGLLMDNFFNALNLDTSVGRAITQHSNLLPKKSSKTPDKSELSSPLAMQRITHILQETHPRCIIALTQPVFEVIQKLYENNGKSGKLDFCTKRRVYHPGWVLRELEKNDKILIARTPNHPVRHGFWLLPEFATTLANIAREELNADP